MRGSAMKGLVWAWPLLAATLLGYLLFNRAVKTWLLRRKWI